MTLKEMSDMYAWQSEVLRGRIAQVAALEVDEEQRHLHHQRLKLLRDMQRESRELATLTARYYERGYAKYGKYAL